MAKEENVTREQQTPKQEVRRSTGNLFTYIGQGEDPPRKINFMGKQIFVRGVAVEITDGEVLKKIKYNKSFIAGEVEMEYLHEQDEAANKKAEAQRVADQRVNAAFQKKYKQAPKGEE